MIRPISWSREYWVVRDVSDIAEKHFFTRRESRRFGGPFMKYSECGYKYPSDVKVRIASKIMYFEMREMNSKSIPNFVTDDSYFGRISLKGF